MKLLPDMHKESTQAIITLTFTFIALGILGIFAIGPTLSTIVTLKRQLSDSQEIQRQLQEKIANLSSLQQQYNQLSPDLPFVYSAIPATPQAPLFTAQLQTLIQSSNLHITAFRVEEVNMSENKPDSGLASSFTFTIQAKGNFEDMTAFVSKVTNMSRIVTIETFSIIKDENQGNLVLSLKGRQYFKP